VVEKRADCDEPARRVPDQHAVAHVEVLQDRGVVGGHGLRPNASGADRGAAVAPWVERNDPMTAV
jgi:hypothetical protein